MALDTETRRASTTPNGGGEAILRPVEREDGVGIHALLRDTFVGVIPDRKRWLRRWMWQYWENPWRGERPAGWVLVSGERILGHMGAVYVPYRIGAESRTAMIGADFAVSDRAAKVGHPLAGLELAGHFFDDADGLIPMATTANASTQAVFARHGCRAVTWTREFWRAPVTLSQRIRTYRGAGNRLARRILTGFGGESMRSLAEKGYRFTGSQPQVPVPHGHSLEYVRVQEMGTGGDAFEVDEDVIGIDPTEDWFVWRYLNHPDSERFHAVRLRDEKGMIVAWAIVGVDRVRDETHATLMELHAAHGRDRCVLTLMCAAIELAHRLKADWLVTQTGRSSWRDLFWELGFESRTRSAPAVTVHMPEDQHIPGDFSETLMFWHGAMF